MAISLAVENKRQPACMLPYIDDGGG